MCHSYCEVCFGSTNNDCNVCKSGYFIDDTTCDTSCQEGKWPNENPLDSFSITPITVGGSTTTDSTTDTTDGDIFG